MHEKGEKDEKRARFGTCRVFFFDSTLSFSVITMPKGDLMHQVFALIGELHHLLIGFKHALRHDPSESDLSEVEEKSKMQKDIKKRSVMQAHPYFMAMNLMI